MKAPLGRQIAYLRHQKHIQKKISLRTPVCHAHKVWFSCPPFGRKREDHMHSANTENPRSSIPH
jgi:hypothetical protein